MNLKRAYPKKCYKIEFIDNEFVMSGPFIDGENKDVQVWKNKNVRVLANQAFDMGADEVAHNYNLGVVDTFGNLR